MVEFGTMITMLVCSITKDDFIPNGNGDLKKEVWIWLNHYWNEENEFFPVKHLEGAFKS